MSVGHTSFECPNRKGVETMALVLVRLVVDDDMSKSIVLEMETAKRVAKLLEELGHKVTWKG
jgi:ribosomal protein S17